MARVPHSGSLGVRVRGSGPGADELARRLSGRPAEERSPAQVIVVCAVHEQELRSLLDECRNQASADSSATLLELSPIAALDQIDLAARFEVAGLTLIGGRRVPLADARSALYVDDAAVTHPALTGLLPLLADEVVATGAAGNAKIVGMLADLLAGVNTAITREALALGECAGIDPATLIRLIATGSGANAVLSRMERAGGAADGRAGDDDARAAMRRGIERAAAAALAADHSLFFGSLAIASLLGARDPRAPIRANAAATAASPA